LSQLFQVLGVRVLVDVEVRLHCTQLVVFERRSHALRPRLLVLLLRHASGRAHRRRVCGRGQAGRFVGQRFHRRR